MLEIRPSGALTLPSLATRAGAPTQAELDDLTLGIRAAHRPGLHPELFTETISAADPVTLPELDEALILMSAEGKCANFVDGRIGTRYLTPLDLHRTYRARGQGRMRDDSTNPDGETVEARIYWYGNGGAAITPASTRLAIRSPLTVAGGVMEFDVSIARVAPAEIITPASARYARVTFERDAADGSFDIYWLALEDATDGTRGGTGGGGGSGGDVFLAGTNNFTGANSFVQPVAVGDPVADGDAVNKAAMDAAILAGSAGIAWHAPVAVATIANITLSGEQTIDDFTTAAMRVLVKNQTTPAQNGVYLSGAGAWVRATDSDSEAELIQAGYLVVNGTANNGTQWVCNTPTPITVGTTALAFVKISSSAAVPYATPSQAVAGGSKTTVMSPYTDRIALDNHFATTFTLPRREFQGGMIAGTSGITYNSDGTVNGAPACALIMDHVLTPDMLAARDAGTPLSFWLDKISGTTPLSNNPDVQQLVAAGGATLGGATEMVLEGTRWRQSLTLAPTCTAIRLRWGAASAVVLSRLYISIGDVDPADPATPEVTQAQFMRSPDMNGPVNLAHISALLPVVGSGGTLYGNQIFVPSAALYDVNCFIPPNVFGASDYFTALFHIDRGYIGALTMSGTTGLAGGGGPGASQLVFLGNGIAMMTGPAWGMSPAPAVPVPPVYFNVRIDARTSGVVPAGDVTVTLLYLGKGTTLPANARHLADAIGRAAYVDLLAPANGDGSSMRPFRTVEQAMALGATDIYLRAQDTAHRGALAFFGARQIRIGAYHTSTDPVGAVARLWNSTALVQADFTAPDPSRPNLFYYAASVTPGAIWERASASWDPPRMTLQTTIALADANPGSWFWGSGPLGIGVYVYPTGGTMVSKLYELPGQQSVMRCHDCQLVVVDGVEMEISATHAVDLLRTTMHCINRPTFGRSGAGANSVTINDACISGNMVIRYASNDGLSFAGRGRADITWIDCYGNTSDGIAPHGEGNYLIIGYAEIHDNGKQGFVTIGSGRSVILAGNFYNNVNEDILIDPADTPLDLPSSFFIGPVDVGDGAIVINNLHSNATLIGQIKGARGGISVIGSAGAELPANAKYCEVKIVGHRGNDAARAQTLLQVNGGYVETDDFKLTGGGNTVRLLLGTLKAGNGHILRGLTGILQSGGTLTLDANNPINVPLTGTTGAPTTRTSGVSAPNIALLASVAAV